MTLSFGSLFSGIGGLELGFERAGLVCKWQIEIDDYANQVLAKHWPSVRRWPDVRTWPQPDTERVDVICGGFPCMDISEAGRNAGIHGRRTGMWVELARIVSVLRPKYVVMENVAALLKRGLGRVLGAMAEIGYNAEWHCISASSIGAPHERDRIFIICHTNSVNFPRVISRQEPLRTRLKDGSWWESEPGVRRVATGIPYRMDRLRCLGNSVVPQIAEMIGRELARFDSDVKGLNG